VHAARLAELKQQADAAASSGDRIAELSAWREAAALIPSSSRQHALLATKIAELSARAEATPSAPSEIPKTGPWRWLSGLGGVGVAIWKFKFLLIAFLGKGKLLLLGLTKVSTVLSMLLAFGVYWTAWGMWFALGFVLSIYVHEMGHVAAVRRFGLDATAPMFVPGLGAFILLKGRNLSPYQSARIGLAGPLWGLAAALAALTASRIGGGPMWAAIAHTGAWLNLFNLMPIWQLDGSRGLAALSKGQRAVVALSFGAAWMLTGDGLLVLLLLIAIARTFEATAPELPDHGALAYYAFLILALAVVFNVAKA